MRNVCVAMSMLLGLLFWNGCASMKSGDYGVSLSNEVEALSDISTEASLQRKIVWTARLTVEVGALSNATAQATSLVKKRNGFIESKSDYQGRSEMTLRIPADVFETTVADLGRIGSVSHQDIKGEDVTERYVDMKARLNSKQLLRDRLQALLDKATDVKDILAIEIELNRVQSDLDSMEARILQLAGHIQYSVVHLTLTQEEVEKVRILGPLGYLFKGLYWGIEKLFVIQ